MVAVPKRALTKAFRKAARLPARAVSGGAGSGREKMSPGIGELPVVLLRVQVIGCKDLCTKDKSGTSDPFVVVSFARNRHQTPVSKKTLNPVYASKDATFDFPIYLSLADKLGVLELVVWDKDMLRKDYLDEAALGLEDWFKDPLGLGFSDPNNMPFSVSLVSTRASTRASGTIQVKVGFVKPPVINHSMSFEEIYKELTRRSLQADISIVSAPPTEGIGTVRTYDAIPTYENDGLSSDEGEDMDDEDEYRDASDFLRGTLFAEPTPLDLTLPSQYFPPPSPRADGEAGSRKKLTDSPDTERPATPIVVPPTPMVRSPSAPLPLSSLPSTSVPSTPTATTPKAGKFPKMTLRRPSLNPRRTESSVSSVGTTYSTSATPAGSRHVSVTGTTPTPMPTPTTATRPQTAKKRKFSRAWVGKRNKREYRFNAANDILGIVMVEIQKAEDLPKLRNMTRLGWDMDPFVVCSFGKKVYRTRVIRHSLNPIWDEKLIFQVRRYETAFKVQLTVLDWDKLSSNDHVGDAFFNVADLIKNAPQPDARTGLYPESTEEAGMQEMKLGLTTAREKPWEAKHNPVLTVRARYQPYDALRQRFWRQYLKQYDSDDTGTISKLELTSTLDSLNSTLAHETIDSFFTRHGKSTDEELTIDEAIQCIEQELCRPASEKRHVDTDETGALETSTTATPMLINFGDPDNEGRGGGGRLSLDDLDFSGPAVHPSAIQPDTPSGDERDGDGQELRVEVGEEKKDMDRNRKMVHDLKAQTGKVGHPTEPSQQELWKAAQPYMDSVATGVPFGFSSSRSPKTPKTPASPRTPSPVSEGRDKEREETITVTTRGKTMTGKGTTSAMAKRSAGMGSDTSQLETPKQVRIAPSRQNTSTSFSFPCSDAEEELDRDSSSGSGSNSNGSASASGSRSGSSSTSATTPSAATSDDSLERVINIKNCPLCHRPRLNSKAEMDIVTHLAICASQDWGRVDRIMVGNFVTASQAQRKWYTKVISKVSSGNYKLGANSANIIVQNRITGQLEEEKMQVYVRLGIRLLYKGAKGRMEGARARRLLKSMSIKQGMKYDSPESVRDIPAFIQFHNLKIEELLLPLSEYKTFNQFFYRKLKPDARPVENPEDPTRLVSAADCRMMAFETVSEATRLWIKGREFTVARLLGDAYKDQWERYVGGALAIFRLAPQDYHRFHCPVDGTVGPMTYISGEYYTVNPQAIRTGLDVYGENARKIVPIDSPTFGRVMCVCIGAMMVGSIIMTVNEGQEVKRGEELGYFAFGGSTVVCLFEKGMVQWDEDLLINGRASLETLVRVGMGIGRCPPKNPRRLSPNREHGSYIGRQQQSQ